MDWYPYLYSDTKIRKQTDKIRMELEQGIFEKQEKNLHLITLARNSANLMEIISAADLKNRYLYDTCPLVLGMAGGKRSAILLAARIIKDTSLAIGALDVRLAVKRGLLPGNER